MGWGSRAKRSRVRHIAASLGSPRSANATVTDLTAAGYLVRCSVGSGTRADGTLFHAVGMDNPQVDEWDERPVSVPRTLKGVVEAAP
jgi:hypothetical protein